MRCLLRGHSWRRVGNVLVCVHCYKRRQVFETPRCWRTTRPPMEERGAVDLVELLMWSALVGIVGGFLLAFVMHAQRVQDDCAGLDPAARLVCIQEGHQP